MKRIITCSDGTWNKPGDEFEGKYVITNVQKIFEGICNEGSDGTKQIKYYDQGIGAEGSFFSKMIDGSTGRGIDENILDVYKFLAWNYEQGDEIYLFGFSRGAYTARSLAGMIYNSGIVKNNDLRLIQQAYDIYRDRNDPAKNPNGETARKFRETHSQPSVKIKFIGVWDTVGALGIPSRSFQGINDKKYAFHDTVLNSQVDYAYQALAVDEKRENFQPTLWTQSKNAQKDTNSQVMEQVWFAGVHSNIGGGYPDEGLSDIALDWMIGKAHDTGLSFEPEYLKDHIKPNPLGELYNSKKFPFSMLKNFVRPVNKKLDANESVHPAVFERIKAGIGYKPENVDFL